MRFAALALIGWQGRIHVEGSIDRKQAYGRARDYANLKNKPLLVIGGPGAGFKRNYLVRLFKIPLHGCGDTCLDLDIGACSVCGAEVKQVEADVRNIPYPDSHFGSAFASHVLEHLRTIDDAEKALDELYRVADKVFIVSPSKQDITAWVHPDHHLWIRQDAAGFLIEQRG
ncbi:MAG TPA: methyltransferase domain-containing protein [Dehalococcoidales bacterium]|nr:methyltransferase domain-containing protein [Dehalococcoidales bacterium]